MFFKVYIFIIFYYSISLTTHSLIELTRNRCRYGGRQLTYERQLTSLGAPARFDVHRDVVPVYEDLSTCD